MSNAESRLNRGELATACVLRVGERRLPACRSRQLAETGKWRRVRIARAKMLPAGLPATTGWQPVLPGNRGTRPPA
jgi:hypothetical protein